MNVYPILRELPNEYLAAIGLVCFEWAQQERTLMNITFGLLNVGPKHGRVAVRSPRATDQVAMIRQLMHLEKVRSEEVDLDRLSETLGKLERYRDLVAHGIWLRGENDTVLLQDLSGNWRPDPKQPKVSRRITPQGVGIDPEGLQTLARLIRETRKATELLSAELASKLLPLRQKSQQLLPEDHLPDGHYSGNT